MTSLSVSPQQHDAASDADPAAKPDDGEWHEADDYVTEAEVISTHFADTDEDSRFVSRELRGGDVTDSHCSPGQTEPTVRLIDSLAVSNDREARGLSRSARPQTARPQPACCAQGSRVVLQRMHRLKNRRLAQVYPYRYS